MQRKELTHRNCGGNILLVPWPWVLLIPKPVSLQRICKPASMSSILFVTCHHSIYSAFVVLEFCVGPGLWQVCTIWEEQAVHWVQCWCGGYQWVVGLSWKTFLLWLYTLKACCISMEIKQRFNQWIGFFDVNIPFFFYIGYDLSFLKLTFGSFIFNLIWLYSFPWWFHKMKLIYLISKKS